MRALESLAVELEQVVADGDGSEHRARWRVLDAAWRREIAAVTGDGVPPDAETTVALAALTRRKAAADARRRELEGDAKAARDREREKNLARVGKLVEGVEAAIANEKLSLTEAERQLRVARQTVEKPPPLPSRRDQEHMTRRLKEGVGELLGKVRELRDFADWQRWANLGVQEELCQEMEALASPAEGAPEMTTAELTRAFTDLMKRWRGAADVPQDKGQALWERFRKAHDLVYPRCEPVFAAQRQEREQSLARRVALVEEAERLSGSTDWLKTAQRLTALQEEWKTLGSAPRKEQQALWGRLRQACSTFFTRRKADLAGRKQEWAANFEKKEALCVRVEALLEAEDLKAAIEEVKQIQREWKTIGPVRRNRSDAVWQRFRTACDGVFDRLNEGTRRAAAERIAVREALCAELEALAAPVASAPSEGRSTGAEAKPASEAEAGTEEVAVEAGVDDAVGTGEETGGNAAGTVETAGAGTAEAAGEAGADGTGAEAAAAAGAETSLPAPRDPVKTVRDIQDRWRRAPDVPPEVKRKLTVRFSRAIARIVDAHADQFRGTEHDPVQRLKQLERLCKRAEALVEAEASGDAGVSPAELLARKWRAQMAANTMGVRVDEQAKRRAARDDVKRLQAERRRLGTLTGADADTLQARFQRACDRVFRENPA